MKKIIKILFALLALLAVTAAFLPYDSMSKKMLSGIESAAKTKGVHLEAEDFKISFPATISFSRIGGILKTRRFPIPFSVESGELRPKLSSLLALKMLYQGTAQFYGGELGFNFKKFLTSEKANLNFRAKNVHLSKHPASQLIGLKGLLTTSGFFQWTEEPPHLPTQGELHAALKQGHIETDFKIQGLIPIPETRNLTLRLSVLQSGKNVALKTAKLNSSLGMAAAKGKFTLTESGEISSGQAKALISLSEEGQAELGGYLALAAGLPPDKIYSQWQVKADFDYSSENRAPKIEVRPKSP